MIQAFPVEHRTLDTIGSGCYRPRMSKRKKYHISEIEDAAVRWLRGRTEQLPLFERVNGRVYVSVNALAALANRSRAVVKKSVDRMWADAAPYRGLGTPMRPKVFEDLVEKGRLDIQTAFEMIDRAPAEQRQPAHTEQAARQALRTAAERLVAGQPSALAHERGAVRFSCVDAVEGTDMHHLTIAHGMKKLGLWDRDRGAHEHSRTRAILGKPVVARLLIEILRAEGVDVEAVAKRLLEIKGERERTKLPGRYVLPARKRVEPDHELEAFDAAFGQWLEREHKAGRISDGMLYGGYAELRARYADLCGGIPRKRPKPDERDARDAPARERSTPVGHELAHVVAEWLNNPWERPGPITMVKAQVYVNVSVLARLAERSRKNVHRYVWEHWRKRETDHDHGIPITQQAYDLILDAADMDSAQAQATIKRD